MGGGHWPESPAWIQTESCEWDGTCWAEGTDLNQARGAGAAAGQGTTTASLFFAGIGPAPSSPNLDNTESYNGTSWSAVNDLISA